MMRPRLWITFTVLAASLLARAAGANEFEEKRFYVTPFVGGTLFDSDRKLLTGEDLPNDMYFGGRAGVRMNRLLWLDLAGGYTTVKVCDCDWVDWMHYSANLMFSRASLQTINPFISIGGGWSSFKHMDGSAEKLGTFEAAGGLRVRLNEVLGIRLEARDVMALPSSDWSKAHLNDIVLGAGLTFGFGGAKAKEVDSDGDGVYDGQDNCPDTPGGCKVDVHGCPIDSDRDGVCDGLDQCPDTPYGCQVDARGCPIDSDHDGVCDGLDQCPNTRPGATVDKVGCEIVEAVPPEIREREAELLDTGMLRISDINFDFDKSTIRPESFHTLDIVGKVLTKWPGLRIEIGGHTDSRGTAAYNMALSHRRAESVRAYLLAHFPEFTPGQLTARGFGESVPLVANDSEAHMQQNRRVEFKVLNREMLRRDK